MRKNTQKTEKAWNGLYVHRAARDGGNLMSCSLIRVCVDLQTHEDETTALSRNVGNLIMFDVLSLYFIPYKPTALCKHFSYTFGS